LAAWGWWDYTRRVALKVDYTIRIILSVTIWLDYFIGGVPALDYFLLEVADIKKVAARSRTTHGLDLLSELCLIGLAAHFEAYCKNTFAAIVNICPETLYRFSGHRECSLPIRNLLRVLPTVRRALGFLLAEEYDFGSAKTVNSLFFDLLNVTPFSKDEAAAYSDFLNDRNLLVHHGGVYTQKYAGQRFATKSVSHRIHFDSLVVNKRDVRKWADFLTAMATKMGQISQKALDEFILENQIKCNSEKKRAVRALAKADPGSVVADILEAADSDTENGS
jgi:hypothetical protein